MKSAIAAEAGKAAPPVAVAIVATARGWTLQDWVAIATLAYIGMQAAYLAWKWGREYRRGKKGTRQ